jgi:hypothetical protein
MQLKLGLITCLLDLLIVLLLWLMLSFRNIFLLVLNMLLCRFFFDFEQGKGEILPESWTRFCSLIRAFPKEPLPKKELLDIFYNGQLMNLRHIWIVVLVVFSGKELRLKLKN